MNNLKSLMNVFLSVKDQGIWIEVDLYTRPVRFDRRTRDCLPLPPIARTLVVPFARAHLSFSIQVGSLLRQVRILGTGYYVKVRAHRPAVYTGTDLVIFIVKLDDILGDNQVLMLADDEMELPCLSIAQ
jgi:hypothetical protein